MAFTGNYLCSSFKEELLSGVHDFTANTFRMALYTSAATLDASTTAYSATNEVATGAGYTATGVALTSVTVTLSGTTAYIDCADVAWPVATFTARGALIYNDTAVGNPAVAVLDFGEDKTPAGGTFSVVIPAADPATALIRIV